ncbi:hypothetical protein VULLAG_LOCUS11378 [Vulpes lagopus]
MLEGLYTVSLPTTCGDKGERQSSPGPGWREVLSHVAIQQTVSLLLAASRPSTTQRQQPTKTRQLSRLSRPELIFEQRRR